jgi:hypothetical protein
MDLPKITGSGLFDPPTTSARDLLVELLAENFHTLTLTFG